MLVAGILVLWGLLIVGWCFYARPVQSAITKSNAVNARCLGLVAFCKKNNVGTRAESEARRLECAVRKSSEYATRIYNGEFGFFQDIKMRRMLMDFIKEMSETADALEKMIKNTA